MADKDLAQGQSLHPSDKTRYANLEDAVYAQTVAAVSVAPDGAFPPEDITGAAVSILYAHHEIHEGDTFLASYKSPDAAPIADNATIVFAMQTGARYCHVVARAAFGGDAEGELREGAAIQAGTGTATVAYNKNRASANAATATVIRDPNITNAGTLIENEFLPGGTGPLAVGGASIQRAEWVLARNTLYLFRMTNRAGAAQPGSLALEWYEEGLH
jgi:hypothetical protein